MYQVVKEYDIYIKETTIN